MIADWDSAFSEGNAHGILGHLAPQDRRHEDENYRLWSIGMYWTEDRTSESTIKQFQLDGDRAFMVLEQNRRTCFRRPLPIYRPLCRLLLGLFSNFVIIEREVKRTEWVKSGEGWLCRSQERLTYRTRLQLRRNSSKPA